jgi:hypothetical protein
LLAAAVRSSRGALAVWHELSAEAIGLNARRIAEAVLIEKANIAMID